MFQKIPRPTAMAVGLVTFIAAGFGATAPALASPSQANGPRIFRPLHSGASSTNNNLYYHGGTGGIGIETTPAVYLVLWGYGTYGDPDQVSTYLQNFLNGVGGSSWLNTVTQYCQGVSAGTVSCGSGGQFATNPSGILKGVWNDNTNKIPRAPTQSALAAEAVRAAAHFSNTIAGSNASAQYVVATAYGHNSSGFGVQWCAYHSSSSSSYGNIAYTNLPYIPQAGASCGAGFVNPGNNLDGVSIVEGHELAETVSDQFPNGGWLDSGGSEIGDKCAWISSGQGAASDVSLGSGSYAVQSLWSNAFNPNGGGCVLSY